MLKEDLVEILELPPNCEISDVYSKARRYAKNVHSDAHPDKHLEWMRFEPAWDVIKKLHTQKRSFDEYSDELNQVKWKPRHSSTQNTASSHRHRSEEGLPGSGDSPIPPKTTKKGADIFLKERISFDDLVNGCTLILRIPRHSALFQPNNSQASLEVLVSPMPLTFNKNGSIKTSALDRIFNRKVKVPGAGQIGSNGGRAGDLIIHFEVDFENLGRSIQEVIHTLNWQRCEFIFQKKSASPLGPFLGFAMIIGGLLVVEPESAFRSFLGVAGFFGGCIYLVSALLEN